MGNAQCLDLQHGNMLCQRQSVPQTSEKAKNTMNHNPNVKITTISFNTNAKQSKLYLPSSPPSQYQEMITNTKNPNNRAMLAQLLIEKLNLNVKFANRQTQMKVDQMRQIITNIVVCNHASLIYRITQIQLQFRNEDKLKSEDTNILQQKSEEEEPKFNEKLYKWLLDVDIAQMKMLDMLYHNRSQSPRFHRDLPNHKIVSLKKILTGEQTLATSYEQIKQDGLKMIQEGKVLFGLLAGGSQSRFKESRKKWKQNSTVANISSSSHSSHQQIKKEEQEEQEELSKILTPLPIPSKKCMLMLLLDRLQALAELLNIRIAYVLLITGKIFKSGVQNFVKKHKERYYRLDRVVYQQKLLGGIDSRVKLTLNDQKNVSLYPNGSGDLWEAFSQHKQLENRWKQKGFTHLHLFSTVNILEPTFDCFQIGLAHLRNLDFVSKIVDSYPSKRVQRAVQNSIFIDIDGNIKVRDGMQIGDFTSQLQQNPIHQNRKIHHLGQSHSKYAWCDSTIYKIDYLIQKINSLQWLQKRTYRSKLHQTYPYPTISFEKEHTDIFDSNANYMFVHCQRNTTYYPLIYYHHEHSSLEQCAQALSDLHKKQIGIQGWKGRVQIDAFVSVDGQGLQDIKEIFKNKEKQDQFDDIYLQNSPN